MGRTKLQVDSGFFVHEMDAVEVVHLATPIVVDQELLRFHIHVDAANDLVQRLERMRVGR